MAISPLLRALPILVLAGFASPGAQAGTSAKASYVVSLGGTNIATAKFSFIEDGAAYDLTLDANITGLAQLVASGTASVESLGSVSAQGLHSKAFDLTTRASGETFKVTVQYDGADVSAFVVDPPIVNNIDRVPLERKQLNGVNDFMASFVLRANKLDRSLCSQHARIFTGIERFDLSFGYAKDDVATSMRTGYQGPVVLCTIKYKPISGHYTTSEITNSLAEEDRILVWYAPLRQTGWFVPYRVLLTTSVGDLSMVLTSLD